MEARAEGPSISKQLFSSFEARESTLWGEELLKESTGGKLSNEIIDLCDEIMAETGALAEKRSDPTCPPIETEAAAKRVKSLKQRLQELAGSRSSLYDVIRYFKWYKTACVWRYPEVVAASMLLNDDSLYGKYLARAIDTDEGSTGDATTVSLHAEGVQREGEFYGLRPAEARANTFVIRSLHSDVSGTTYPFLQTEEELLAYAHEHVHVCT